ncbi:DUF4240 domain-containing protein [Actinoplanes sp. RD1]|uniref:DUF4240 domain-containing protein n=1 Tax=Actinoplanes sp. RD1 TaxID=3064538 RepID=UPI00274172D8|nr:DUF4240 domain-containing protein [Actinoplanes sp. RD1]
MRIEHFWALIDESARATRTKEARTTWLVQVLAGRPVQDMTVFQRRFEELVIGAGTRQLRSAAWIVGAGLLLDDEFGEFRAWLIGQGRQVYEQVVADPDALASLPAVRALAGRPTAAWAEEEWPEWEVFRRLTEAVQSRLATDPVRGRWRAGDPVDVARRLPRLSALFRAAVTAEGAGPGSGCPPLPWIVSPRT